MQTMQRLRPMQTLPPKVTGYADNIRVDGIAYRVNPATIPAIGIEPGSKYQGLQGIGNYATMQTCQGKAKPTS